MNILVLTKFNSNLCDETTRTPDDYVKKSVFFDGYNHGFMELGHNTHVIWGQSFFIPVMFFRKFPVFAKLLSSLLVKTKISLIDKLFFSFYLFLLCKKHDCDLVFTELNDSFYPRVLRFFAPNLLVTQWVGVFPEMISPQSTKIYSDYDISWGPCEFDTEKVVFDFDYPVYIGCAVNSRIYYYDFDQNYKYDVVFIGGVSKGHGERINILEALANRYDSFAFFGYGIEDVPDEYKLARCYKGYATHSTARKLYSSSKVALNLTLDGYERVAKGFNARLFEISACGGAAQMVVNDAKINDFFVPGEDLECFSNLDELFSKLDQLVYDENLRLSLSTSARVKSSKYLYSQKAKLICGEVYERLNKGRICL